MCGVLGPSGGLAEVIAAIGAHHIYIKPHCPWQSRKVQRLNRTLRTEWASRQPFTSNAQREAAVDAWLTIYSSVRRHHALGGEPPISRVVSPT